jgi:hypothetical protein
MNYFTKEWYELCQRTGDYLSLEEDKEAEFFSEEYFQQLYNQKLTEHLSLQEEIASYNFDDIYPLEISQEPFDRKKASKEFYKAFLYKQEYVKGVLPKEILKRIVDIRVYVLGKASGQVINDVTQFCKENEKLVNKVIKDYEIYYKKASKSFNRNIVDNINFHDCIIKDIKQMEQVLSISFDNSGGFTDIDQINFKSYKIIKQDGFLINSWWLYEEIYKTNDKYELHVLLQNENMNIEEITISAEHISFK